MSDDRPAPPPSVDTSGEAPAAVAERRQKKLTRSEQRAIDAKTKLSSPWASGIAIIIAVLWTIPTFGLLVTSFRPEIDIRRTGWWEFFAAPEVTLSNYEEAMTGSSTALGTYFVNSIVITIPAVIIPITLALLAAYAFAWIEFRGRDILFVAVFALQIVPIQVTLIPLLSRYVDWGLAGSFWTIWLSHSMFALPLAIFLLHNFMKDIPRSLVEAARVDGAGHVKIFFQVLSAAPRAGDRLLCDLPVPLGVERPARRPRLRQPQNTAPLTVRVAELSGTRGSEWHLPRPVPSSRWCCR